MEIQTHHLCRHYARGGHTVRAVDGVSLTVTPGEFVAVVGASGSGKSTLLNLLAGLDTPTSGRIDIDGRSLQELGRRAVARYRARRVGIVFQSFNLLPQHTALRNVELALYFDDTPRSERRERARDALTELGLGGRLQHRPLDLSGGEQQRVALARALVKRPEVLFADEPTGNLDHENADHIRGILAELNRSGITVVMVTHDVGAAADVAHRVVRMHYGQVMEPSDPETEHPGQPEGP